MPPLYRDPPDVPNYVYHAGCKAEFRTGLIVGLTLGAVMGSSIVALIVHFFPR